jgi:hypothetical protein
MLYSTDELLASGAAADRSLEKLYFGAANVEIRPILVQPLDHRLPLLARLLAIG